MFWCGFCFETGSSYGCAPSDRSVEGNDKKKLKFQNGIVIEDEGKQNEQKVEQDEGPALVLGSFYRCSKKRIILDPLEVHAVAGVLPPYSLDCLTSPPSAHYNR